MMSIWRRVMRPVIFFSALLLFANLQGAGVHISCAPFQATARQGEKIILNFTVSNLSAYTMNQAGNFFISYHVRDLSGRLVRFDNRRFSLPLTVKPGSTAHFSLPVYFSLGPGNYRLEWDLVREGEFWGLDKKWESCFFRLRLLPLVAPDFRKAWLPTSYESDRDWLDREQYLLRQVFLNNEIRWRGKFFGFTAGTTYPQVWIRDAATMMFYARFFYPLPVLQEMVDLFFLRQGRDGQIQDWIDTVGRCDKNTVETDQESSLVLAAFQLALCDRGWLDGKVAGVARLLRLDKAMEWVWQNKRDRAYGLIWSGFTADWGDVEKSYPDQRAIKLSDRSRRTYSTYTQALYIQAAQKLVLLAGRANRKILMEKWRQRGKIIADNCRRQLYLPEQGYFLVHRVAGSPDFFELEKGILAVGGNAEAIRAGLLDGNEISRLLQVLEKRRRQFGLRTVSFTLLPPYPRDFFPHPLLRMPWNYQNGGEWDWIGGRLVSALYQAGFRTKAEQYLREIVAKNLDEMNIFEWSDKSGGGQGAMFYAGAAGVLGEAILHGHLGLAEDFDRYTVPVGSDRFKIMVTKSGDRFTVENSDKVTVDISALSKKEICILTASSKKNICVSKKGKIEIPKK
ncbi:MAG: hypothetical protein MUP71_04380 [Candidatus Aminicenantes bacterium]|nr:hypothetical protein [Candidatus Aminicenantes bacterium]